MAIDNVWAIVFYTEDSGRIPVREFLESLDETTRLQLAVSIGRLRRENISAQEPLVKKIEGRMWELRRESNTNAYRILYFFFTGRKIVLLHGFQKKTQKTPRTEIETANRRLAQYVARHGGDLRV